MIKGNGLKLKILARDIAILKVFKCHPLPAVKVYIGTHYHLFKGRKIGNSLLDFRANINNLAFKVISIGGEQDLGLNLTKAIQDSLGSKIGRARRPNPP